MHMRELEVKHETATRRMGEMHMDLFSSAPPHRKPEVFMQNKVTIKYYSVVFIVFIRGGGMHMDMLSCPPLCRAAGRRFLCFLCKGVIIFYF
jgi:hypothetical protein